MNSDRTSPKSLLDRRALALRLAAAAAGASLISATEIAAAADLSEIDAVFALSPATLTPQQRLDVRNGVRELQKTLAQARSRELPNDADPAFVFQTVTGG